MCLILLAHAVHPSYRLILTANRDEFYDRPSQPAHRWADAPRIVAGRDLRSGGTWLGVTGSGRWAAVTNFRDASEPGPTGPSRGHLVADFLRGDAHPRDYAAEAAVRGSGMNGFNLLIGDADGVWWISNRTSEAGLEVGPGFHGISNALLNTPWPKVVRGKEELERLVSAPGAPDPAGLIEILLDRTLAAEHELPRTGVEPELERALSSRFIATAGYGTRSSTALLIHRRGGIVLVERTYHVEQDPRDPSGSVPLGQHPGDPGRARWTEVRHELIPET
jgi:uncharacterized protein with NRDE domain